MTPDYSEKIPNNVGLREDRRLQRALESWQPNFLSWWESMGPTLPTRDVYLRTAVNVGREGWAHFGHVAMRDYRWGIFLAERDPDRRIGFGDRDLGQFLGGQRRQRHRWIGDQPVEREHARRHSTDDRPHQPLRRHPDYCGSRHGRTDDPHRR